jgi:hypothetical protein
LRPLTDQGWQTISRLAQKYGISTDAVMTMLQAVANGHGSMAQFCHGELGGAGQWMRGGMTMVGDMFNHGLKAKVDSLCNDLSQLLDEQPFVAPASVTPHSWQGETQQQQPGGYGVGHVSLFVPQPSGSGSWWPAGLGSPNSVGGQNNVRYAYFAGARRLAVDVNGHVTVYDTLDHQIGGVSQQQGVDSSVTFTSQHGTVSVASLPVVPFGDAQLSPPGSTPPREEPSPSPAAPDILAAIERLAELCKKGILSQDEFTTKKAELLSRL